MDQQIQQQLFELAAISRNLDNKLSKKDTDQAGTLLGQCLADGGVAFSTALKYVRDFPAESLGKAIRDSWSHLPPGAKVEVQELLSQFNAEAQRFKKMRFLAAAAVLDVDRDWGRNLAFDICSALTGLPGKQLKNPDIVQFRSLFLEDDSKRLEKIDISNSQSTQIEPFLRFIMAAAFPATSAPAPTSLAVQIVTIQWLAKNNALAHLAPLQQTQLIQTIKGWDWTSKQLVREKLESIPTDFEFLLEPEAEPTDRQTNQQATEATVTPVEPASAIPLAGLIPPSQTAQLTPAPPSNLLGVSELLAEIEKQFKSVEQVCAKAQQELASSEEEAATLKRSLRDARAALTRAEEELSSKVGQLAAANEAHKLSKEQSATFEKHLADEQTAFSEAKRKHDEEVHILKSRIETESTRAVDNFKHTLGGIMRVEHTDFQTVEMSPMTIEIGDSLRRQLAAIFNSLQQKGIIKKA